MTQPRTYVIPLLILAGCLAATACGDKPSNTDAPAAEAVKSDAATGIVDKPLAPFQAELLDTAFEIATSIPVKPHIKDRSKAQEGVLVGWIDLEQPGRAIKNVEKIEDWRRGSCYADLAFYFVKQGRPEDARMCLKQAEQISQTAEDWRRDLIRAKIGSVHALLGNAERAGHYSAGLTESETGKVAAAQAMVADEASFDARIKELDALVALQGLDTTKNAINAYAQLFDRFYTSPAWRSLAEDRIKKSWEKVPVFLRIEALNNLAKFALGHEDHAKALELLDESQKLLDDHAWPLEIRMPMASTLAELRHRAGDKEKAKADADALHARYDAEGKSIINIDKAKALRPLAEAYQTMGDGAAALTVYKKAVEAGFENPNARPRAEDLSATCVSMATSGVEPDADLRARIESIRKELKAPW